MHLPVTFKPIYQERVWGGRGLASLLGRTLPGGNPIGESWEIVDRPEAQSVVASGLYEGLTLRELIHARCADIMGPDWPVGRAFPILVKWLDCRERLSLQVHPPADVAPLLKGEPKTENWFIAHCEPDAGLMLGLEAGVTREQFERAITDNTLERCVRRVTVQPGDSAFVWSGTVHAIDAGNLILEIQQNSDTTYRVYDWGRVGLDGKPRKLHVAESMQSILFNDPAPELVRAAPTAGVIADCREFRIRRLPLRKGAAPFEHRAGEQCRLLHIVSGSLRARELDEKLGTFVAGENILLPYAGGFVFDATEDALVLVTENFT